jgi:hypothetical protein
MHERKSWRTMIEEERKAQDDVEIMICTLSEQELDREFDPDSCGCEGKPFFAWSDLRVYFATAYDGEETVGSVPRHPCEEGPKYHI